MKKFITAAVAFLCIHISTLAQNVGIGTPTPTGKLQINLRSDQAPGLKLVDSPALYAGTIHFRNLASNRGINLEGYSYSNFYRDQYLDIRSDSTPGATIRGNGFVGVKNLDPQYPLDVAGDINTTGAIRINNNAGTSGQTLMSNGDGTMSWGDVVEFKNIARFAAVGAGNWTVPAGVTKIMVEAWGAGGGGNAYAGGGGGGYVCGVFTVTPGYVVNFSIGDGGLGAHEAAGGGQSTSITGPLSTLFASGGSGASYNAGTLTVGTSNGGGFVSSSGTFRNWFGIWGEPGRASEISFFQSGATTYMQYIKGSDGGNGANSVNTGGIGSLFLYNLSASTMVRNKSTGIARQPGGGGPGGYYLNGANFGNGQSGADGLIIIRY